MPARDLPARPNLDQYRKQAKDLLKSWKTADPSAKRKLADAQFAIAREHGFDTWKTFTERIAHLTGAAEKAAIWKSAEDAVVAGDAQTLGRLLRQHEKMLRTERPRSSWFGGLTPNYSKGDARAIIAREHFFEHREQFDRFAHALEDGASAVARFERAADAVSLGDTAALERLLADDPGLIRARSERAHHSTLLHYVGANGVESWRQRPSKNAVRIAELLLDAGAEIDAVADMYKGGCTTLGLIATSIHPKTAGVLHALIDLFLARGARIDAAGAGNAHTLVYGCLANGRPEAAEYLAGRGAPLDMEGAAGVGRLDVVKQLLGTAPRSQINAGFGWACAYGKTEVVEYLLDHGMNVDELAGPHKETGLHCASVGGHIEAVKALLKRRPRLDIRDGSFDGTPLGWAVYGWWERRDDAVAREPYYEIVAILVAAGAAVEPQWLTKEHEADDPRLFAALNGRRERT